MKKNVKTQLPNFGINNYGKDWVKKRMDAIALREEIVEEWKNQETLETAQKIFEYLPIHRSIPENDYINHLWQALATLNCGDELSRPFAIMPFHLLFMLALQYMILRVSKKYKKASDIFFCGVGGRSKEQLLSKNRSVFDIGLINERTMVEIFQLIDVDIEIIKRIKFLIDERNDNLAHAKGGIEPDTEGKIVLYLELLDAIHQNMVCLNDQVAKKWLSKMGKGQDAANYIDLHLAEEYLCPADFNQGKLTKFKNKINLTL